MAKQKETHKGVKTARAQKAENTKAKTAEDKEMVTDILIPDSESVEFICPNCGKISQNDVVFLCNTCDNSELIYKDGIYMCPQCFYPGENFECMKCESKHVQMRKVKNTH